MASFFDNLVKNDPVFGSIKGTSGEKKLNSSYTRAKKRAYKKGAQAGFKRGKRVGFKSGKSRGFQSAQMSFLMSRRRY